MTIKRCVFFLCFLAMVSLFHQSALGQEQTDKELARTYLELAEQIYKEQGAAIEIAKENFIQAAELDPQNTRANFMAGKLYLETVNKDRASKYFLRVMEADPDYRFDLPYLVGRGYQYGMEFEEALKYYNMYEQKLMDDQNYRGQDKVTLSEVKRRIFECENGRDFMANPAHYSIVNIGHSANSEWRDYAPVLNEDETLLIFTSRRREGNLNPNVDEDNIPFEDIFISRKVDGEWSEAENIGDIVNTPYHDSNLALSADGEQLYLYKDVNDGDIYVSHRKDDDTWSIPEPLSDKINSSFKENSISISPDKQLLFYASDRPGGHGGIDIYVSRKDKKGEWSKSENLGPAINTEYDEEGPFIDYDGKTLYFSSQGRKGMGGHDIFKSEYDSVAGEWSEPVNLGYPINTPDNDVYFVSTKDGKRGYYASVRSDGMGYTDIYMVSIPENDEATQKLAAREATGEETEGKVNADIEKVGETVTLVVKVEDYDNGEPLDVKARFRRISDNVVIAVREIEKGTYAMDINHPEDADYMFAVEKDGYMFRNLKIALPASADQPRTITRTIELNRLREGFQSVLRNIYFDFNKATFRKDSYFELNKLEGLLSKNPNIKVEISGHTDNIGYKAYNKDLSQRRANAVVNYLLNKGIDARRVIARGYGEERPLASNDNEIDGRSLNRRVEFKILDKNISMR